MDLVVVLPLLIVLGAFMYFGSRRQKKAMKATIDLHESLQIGEEVHTTSGLRGRITGLSDDYVDLEIAPGVITTWMKLAVRDRIAPETDADDDDVIEAAPEATRATEITETNGVSPTSSDADRLTKD
ncbi:MAG: preprotein translocase subunit YajC [Mycobacterium sp.]